MTLLEDVDYQESQEVLVSNKVRLQFGIGCLSGGCDCPLLALAALACLSPVVDGPVHSQPALLSPLFYERVPDGGQDFSQDLGITIPQSWLLSQASSFRLPSGHSGQVLSLSNATRSSLSLLCFLVGDGSIWVIA